MATREIDPSRTASTTPLLMRAAHAVVLDAATLGADVDLAGMEAATDSMRSYPYSVAEIVSERLAGANVAICNKTVLDEAILTAAPALELVLVTATGVNNIDLAAAAVRGIEVRHCRDYGTPAVAQHTLLLMLALHTRFLDYQHALARGQWQRAQTFCLLDFPILELSARTLGIFGRGAIGTAVAALARAFGMQVLFAQLPDRPARADTLPWRDVLQRADVVSLHCPLTETTRHLLDAAALAAMKPGAFLINTARAAIVEPHALIAALRSGHLGGAALDGLEVEPPRDADPLLEPGIPHLIVTPHNAWASRQARQRLVNQTVENLLAWRRGEVLRRVVLGA